MTTYRCDDRHVSRNRRGSPFDVNCEELHRERRKAITMMLRRAVVHLCQPQRDIRLDLRRIADERRGRVNVLPLTAPIDSGRKKRKPKRCYRGVCAGSREKLWHYNSIIGMGVQTFGEGDENSSPDQLYRRPVR
jgi:hypothetical protein